MLKFCLLLCACCAIVLFTSIVHADVDPIIIKGSKFFYSNNGSQFFVRGILYGDFTPWDSTTRIDPLADEMTCARDIPHFLKLGINTLLVADISIQTLHVGCLKLLNDAGLYILVQWTGSARARVRGEIRTLLDYNYYDEFKSLIDSIHSYPNVLGFMLRYADVREQEIKSIPCSQSVASEMKKHIKAKKYRNIPVGLAGYNHRKSNSVVRFLTCGGEQTSPDFYSLHLYHYKDMEQNSYECANSTMLNDELIGLYHESPLPLLLGYFRCREGNPEHFDEIEYVYGRNMSEVFSGGFLGRWHAQPDSFIAIGLVEVSGTAVSLLPAYSSLSNRLASLPSIFSTQLADYSVPRSTPSSCQDLVLRKGIDTAANITRDLALRPVVHSEPSRRLCHCMMNSITCKAPSDVSIESLIITRETVCRENGGKLCLGTAMDSEQGKYGSYHMCNETEMTSWALEELYQYRNQSAEACTTAGGLIQTPSPSTSRASDCNVLLRQAGPQGTGTVTSTPSLLSDSLFDGSTSKRSSLPIGTKVGIGVGVGVTVILISITTLYLWSRRKKKLASSSGDDYAKAELADTSAASRQPKVNLLDGTERHELDSPGRAERDETSPVEVEGNNGLVELATPYNEILELHGHSRELCGRSQPNVVDQKDFANIHPPQQ